MRRLANGGDRAAGEILPAASCMKISPRFSRAARPLLDANRVLCRELIVAPTTAPTSLDAPPPEGCRGKMTTQRGRVFVYYRQESRCLFLEALRQGADGRAIYLSADALVCHAKMPDARSIIAARLSVRLTRRLRLARGLAFYGHTDCHAPCHAGDVITRAPLF